jgi:hypothetical protein
MIGEGAPYARWLCDRPAKARALVRKEYEKKAAAAAAQVPAARVHGLHGIR